MNKKKNNVTILSPSDQIIIDLARELLLQVPETILRNNFAKEILKV